MAETVLALCGKFLGMKELLEDGRLMHTAVPTGEQFRVQRFTVSGVAVMMSPAGKDDFKIITPPLSKKIPGEFNTADLKLFQKSLALPKNGMYTSANVIVHVWGDIAVKMSNLVLQDTKCPSWLDKLYPNLAKWWDNKPKLLTSLPNSFYGKHPDGGEGIYNVIAVKQGTGWQVYTFGKLRLLNDAEVTELVNSKKLKPIKFK